MSTNPKLKEYYQESIEHFKRGEYKQAFDLLEILLIKDQKNVEYNMSMAAVLTKMNKKSQAEEHFLYAYDKKPKEPKLLAAIYRFYEEDMKNFEAAQKYLEQFLAIMKHISMEKFREYQIKYVKILDKNQEKDKLGLEYEDIMKNTTDIKNIVQVAEIYLQLKLTLKEIDVTEPSKSKEYRLFSETLKTKDVQVVQEQFEQLMLQIIASTRGRYHEIEPSLICYDLYFQALYQLLELFPQSIQILSEVIRYIHCYLEGHISYCAKLAIQHLLKNNEVETVSYRCKIFLTFIKYFASDFLYTQAPKMVAPIEQLIQKQQIDNFDEEDPNKMHLLLIPVRAKQLFSTQQKEKMKLANDLLTDFNEKVKEMKQKKIDVTILDEVSANLGFEVLIDPYQMIKMKDLLKVRIKNKTYSIETYEKYFDYQLKLVHLLRKYDEEIPMRMIFDKILTETPNNHRIRMEREWLNLSESEDQLKYFTEQLKPQYEQILGLTQNQNVISQILRRLGSLSLYFNIEGADQYFLKACELNAMDYYPLIGLGVVNLNKGNFSQAREHLLRAFNICQSDYFLNQMISFLYLRIGAKDEAIKFALNIYKLPEMQSVFWINMLLSQHFMEKGSFPKALELLQKAVDQFDFHANKSYKAFHEKKIESEKVALPYLICQNEVQFLHDYPVISNLVYTNAGMDVFSDRYFTQEKEKKNFNLEMKLAELKKILGQQGSALKSVQRAEKLILSLKKGEEDDNIASLDKILQESPETNLQKVLVVLNKGTIRTKFVSTLKLKKLPLSTVYDVMTLCFSSSQLYLFCQQDYFSQERLVQALICAVYLERIKVDVSKLLEVYVPFVFELACSIIQYKFKFYGCSQAIEASDQFCSVANLFQFNDVYSNECLRNFYFIRGTILRQTQPFEESIRYCAQAMSNLGVDIENVDLNAIRTFKPKKLLLFKNHLFSYGLGIANILSLDNDNQMWRVKTKDMLTIGISLFPEDENMFILLALTSKTDEVRTGALMRALKINPRNQQALNLLGISTLKRQNLGWAQQFFSKAIESEPTNSTAYLGMILVGLRLIKDNTEIQKSILKTEQGDQHFYLLTQTQRQLQSKIESYLKYVSSLENKSFSNLLQIITRHLLLGTTILDEEKQNIDYMLKHFMKFIPEDFRMIVQKEIYETHNFEQLTVPNILNLFEQSAIQVKRQYSFDDLSRFSRLIKLTLKLLSIEVQKDETNVAFIQETVFNRFFKVLRSNLSALVQSTNMMNFNQEFLHLIEVCFRGVRAANIKLNNKYSKFLQTIYKIRQDAKELNEDQSGSQIINHIDQLLVTSDFNENDPETYHKNEFLNQMLNTRDLVKPLRELQSCILWNPGNKKYRQILTNYQVKSRKYSNKELQISLANSKLAILQLSKNNEMKWLDIILHKMGQLNPQKESYQMDIKNIIQIINFRLNLTNDPAVQKAIQIILTDMHSLLKAFPTDQVESMPSLKQDPKINLSDIVLSIQKGNINSLVVDQIQSYLSKYEDLDQIYSKKLVNLLMPIVVALYTKTSSQSLIPLAQQIQQHCLYAQQHPDLVDNQKLRKSRFVLNVIAYSLELHNNFTADSLISLKEISDEFLAQGSFNPLSLSIYTHYLAATQKYDELTEWLSVVSCHFGNNDFLVHWGYIVEHKHLAIKTQDIERVKQFRRSTEEFFKTNKEFFSSALQALLYFLQGQVMIQYKDFQQFFTRDQVMRRYQMACLVYPASAKEISEVVNMKSMMKKESQSKVPLRKFSSSESEMDVQAQNPKKKERDGLNSDSDEDELRVMDMHQDIIENPHLVNIIMQQQENFINQEGYLDQQIQMHGGTISDQNQHFVEYTQQGDYNQQQYQEGAYQDPYFYSNEQAQYSEAYLALVQQQQMAQLTQEQLQQMFMQFQSF